MLDKNENNIPLTKPEAPDTYTHRGAQTPIYSPPPMPVVKPAESSDSKPNKEYPKCN
jgi:hypothetical protein